MTSPMTSPSTPTSLSPAAEALVPAIAEQVGTLLGRISERRMYPTDEAVRTITVESAGWLVSEIDHARPFIPTDTARGTALAIVTEYLLDWVRPYAGTYPEGRAGEVRMSAARDIAARLDATKILLPALPNEESASDLLSAVQYITGRSIKRDGTMGDGYYSTYVSPEDIAAALHAAGWRRVED